MIDLLILLFAAYVVAPCHCSVSSYNLQLTNEVIAPDGFYRR